MAAELTSGSDGARLVVAVLALARNWDISVSEARWLIDDWAFSFGVEPVEVAVAVNGAMGVP